MKERLKMLQKKRLKNYEILQKWLLFQNYSINSSQNLIDNFYALYQAPVKISASELLLVPKNKPTKSVR